MFGVPDAGLPLLLDWMLRTDTGAAEDLAMRLFRNDITPDRGSVFGDFVEADFAGYSQRLLARADYSPAAVMGHVARLVRTAGGLEWIPTAPGEVLFGVYVVGLVSFTVYAARRFASPRVAATGVPLVAIPVFTLQALDTI